MMNYNKVGIFVHDTAKVPYSIAICKGYKPIETRFRNTLKAALQTAPAQNGEVMIIRTVNGKRPMIVGKCSIYDYFFCVAGDFEQFRQYTLIPPGSEYDAVNRGKWLYFTENPVYFDEPIPLPKDVVRHGRSWCEWHDPSAPEYITLSVKKGA